MIGIRIRRALLHRIPATPAASITIRLAGLLGLLAGAALILGGYDRLSSQGYIVIRRVPDAPLVWGGAAALFGAMILIASWRAIWWLKGAGLIGLSAWWFAFGGGIITAAATIPTVGFLGAVAFIYIGVQIAILVWIDERAPAA